jgi:P-type conjugative transfer protein TrbJ
MSKSREKILGAVLAIALALVPVTQARALAVFDAANYSQNLLTAIRTLQMINNQVQQLQNEAQMLINMAKHLERMDYSSLSQLNQAISQINILMQQAQGIAFDVQAAEQAFARYFPEQYQATVTYDELAADARQRWQYSMDAFRQTLRVQSHISQGVVADQQLLSALVSESQGAVGMLQAQQSTNQLIALTSQQTAKTHQLLAAQYRADALDRARRAVAQEQARAQFRRFIGDGQAYTPLQ